MNDCSVSETSKCRERLAPYCIGCGIDIGCGGDVITPHTIGVDMPHPYTKVGQSPIHLKGDAKTLYWFNDEVLDYVYSSHLLEDFPDTETILREWLRVLKIGGLLILFLPDEQLYRKHCDRTGQEYNKAHSISNMSLDYIKNILSQIGVTSEIYSRSMINEYSFEIVVQKHSALPLSSLFQSSYYAALCDKEQEIKELNNSTSYRVGHAFVSLIKKILLFK